MTAVWRCPCGATGERTVPRHRSYTDYRQHLFDCDDWGSLAARQVLWRVLR